MTDPAPPETGGGLIGLLQLDPKWVAGLALVAVFVLLMTERIHRTVLAGLMALALVALGVLDQHQAVAGIDFNTLGLLAGMMVIVALSRRSGLFEFVAIWTAKAVHADPRLLLAAMAVVTAVLSGLLDNVTTVLLTVPVTLLMVEKLRVPAFPFLASAVLSSNIGGSATLIGDPPNILIGSAADLGFTDFLVHVGPPAAINLVITILLLDALWGRKLSASEDTRGRIMAFDEGAAIEDRTLLIQSLTVIGLVILGLVLADLMGLEAATIALIGATVFLALRVIGQPAAQQAEQVRETLEQIEWPTLIFFAALFAIVAAAETSGLLPVIGQALIDLTDGSPLVTVMTVLWSAAIFSAFIDNIPFVATMIPLIEQMGTALPREFGLEPVWWALSLGACLGGNGSLIGAAANVTIASIAERQGERMDFFCYLKVGFPLMLVSVVVATGYLLATYFAPWTA